MKTNTQTTATRRSVPVFLIAALLALLSGPLSAQSASGPDLSAELATLKSLGFHVFPQPVTIDPFNVPALAGGTLQSKSVQGKIVLFNFWATWCPPCKREMPTIETLWNALKGDDFTILAISTGEKKNTVADFIAKNKYTFPIYLDESGALGRVYATQGIPTTYVLDKQGRVIAGIVGSTDYDKPELVKALKSMAAK